jgi:hypothetical protein
MGVLPNGYLDDGPRQWGRATGERLMARDFNPPPGWPIPPEGWRPPPDWYADPDWPPAPEGWIFWVEREPEKKKLRFGRAYLAAAALVALIIVVAIGNSFGSAKSPDPLAGSPSSTATATLVGALPVTSAPSARARTATKRTATAAPTTPPVITRAKTVRKPPVKPPTKPKTPTRTAKPVAPAHRNVTPGAFCKDAEAGAVGYSKTGKRYICSYYSSSDRFRWKPA